MATRRVVGGAWTWGSISVTMKFSRQVNLLLTEAKKWVQRPAHFTVAKTS